MRKCPHVSPFLSVVVSLLFSWGIGCGDAVGGIGTDDDLADAATDARADARPPATDSRSSGDDSRAPSPPPSTDASVAPPPASDVGVDSAPPSPPTTDDGQHCVDVLNAFRAKVGKPPLTRSSALEAYATEGAKSDAASGTPHGHFTSTDGGGIAWAENEVPGWPLTDYGSTRAVIDQGTQMMWDEGPGGGHYENIVGDYTEAGCGVFVTSSGDVWVTQDFK